MPDFLLRKLLRALLPTLLAYQIIIRNTLDTFPYGLVVTYIFMLLLLWRIENKKYIRYYTLKSVEILLYFMPFSALIFTFVLTGTLLTQGSGGIGILGGLLSGALFIIFTLVVGIGGGLILFFTNRPPKKSADKDLKTKTKNYRLPVLYVIIVSCILGFTNTANSARVVDNQENEEQGNEYLVNVNTNNE